MAITTKGEASTRMTSQARPIMPHDAALEARLPSAPMVAMVATVPAARIESALLIIPKKSCRITKICTINRSLGVCAVLAGVGGVTT